MSANAYEEMLSDLEQAHAAKSRFHEALEHVMSALEDIGLEGCRAHEIAANALKGAA